MNSLHSDENHSHFDVNTIINNLFFYKDESDDSFNRILL